MLRVSLAQEPQLISRYLLGDTGRFSETEGLLRRVEKSVRSLDTGYGPQFQTGSIQLVGVSGGDSEEPERIEEVFELAVGLNEWMGQGIGTGTHDSKKHLWEWLRKNQLTDVEYLVGWSSDDEGADGKLSQVRSRLRDLLNPDPIPDPNMTRAVSLMEFLRHWLGECTHDFHEEPSEVRTVHIYRCRSQFCDAGYAVYDGSPEWFSVGG